MQELEGSLQAQILALAQTQMNHVNVLHRSIMVRGCMTTYWNVYVRYSSQTTGG